MLAGMSGSGGPSIDPGGLRNLPEQPNIFPGAIAFGEWGTLWLPWIFGWNPPPNFQRALMILLGWWISSCGLIRMMIHYVLQPFTSFFLKPQPCYWGPTKWPWDSHTSLTRGWWRETLQSRKDGHALCSRRGQVPWLDGWMVCSGL